MIPIGQWPARNMTARTQVAAGSMLVAMLLLYAFAGASVGTFDRDNALAGRVIPARDVLNAGVPKGAPPVPEPLAFREMAPQDAVAFNAAIPISDEPNPAARSFRYTGADDHDRMRSIDCLTAAVFYEAAIEPLEGQRAVAQVVLNRLRHPAYPKTVCGVVFQGAERSTGCQFTFTCDGALARRPSVAGWARARRVASEALAGKVYKPVGWATHYHTNWVVPYWSNSLTKVANVGTHIFYRWEGGWGRPGAFRGRHAGLEPQIAAMRPISSVPFDETIPTIDTGLLAAVKVLPPGVTPEDFKGRAVIRQYQPLREQSAAEHRDKLARADVPESVRWALTGERESAKPAEPAGKPADPAAVERVEKVTPPPIASGK